MFRTLAKLDLASLALRLALAAIFISLGLTKLSAGWGTSWDHNPAYFVPAFQAVIAWCELLAGIGMLFGLLTRVSALALLVVMIGQIWWMNFHPDFVARWQDRSQQFFSAAPVSWPYAYAVAGMCLALLILGGGLLSIDYLLRWSFSRHEDMHPSDTAVVTTPTVQSRPWTFSRVFYVFRPRGHGSLPS
ncbi:MAG TPA: DoxX family protein [Gemmataceae bacterium]|nr:DoxX family protein [Gemmataceae bacterium]